MELEGLSRKELIDIINARIESPYFIACNTIQKQINDICADFESSKIDTKSEENKQFQNFLAFIKVVKSALEDLDDMVAKLNPDEKARLRKEQKKAATASVEDFVLNKNSRT